MRARSIHHSMPNTFALVGNELDLHRKRSSPSVTLACLGTRSCKLTTRRRRTYHYHADDGITAGTPTILSMTRTCGMSTMLARLAAVVPVNTNSAYKFLRPQRLERSAKECRGKVRERSAIHPRTSRFHPWRVQKSVRGDRALIAFSKH